MSGKTPGSLAITGWLVLALLAPPALAAGDGPRLERIARSGELRVCIWPDYYGITWRDPKSAQLSGIDIDMARALAGELGVRAAFIESSFGRLFDDLLSQRCDIAMFAIGVTPARQAKLQFTTPHLQSDVYAITTRANRRIRQWNDIDQPGVVVAVARGTLHEGLMRERLKAATLKVVDTPLAREQEVESGRADVFITDYPYSRRMLDNADWARLITPDTSYHITPYGYAMAPGDAAFHARVERFVADARRDGRLLAAARRVRLEAIVRPD